MSELGALLHRHCLNGSTATAIPRLTLSRSDVKTSPTHVVYSPLLCVIAEGRKRVFLGNEEFHYDPMNYLVSSLDLPVSGQVIEAPCLGLALALDLPTLAALLLEMPPRRSLVPSFHAPTSAMMFGPSKASTTL